jgi:enolase-phosphatase E1
MISPSIRTVLLDIEGTTSSIAFVYDVMFPYARSHVESFLLENSDRADVRESISLLETDRQATFDTHDLPKAITEHVNELMDRDSKSTGLKALQGLVWEAGFLSGEIRSHLFEDVYPALQAWRNAGLNLAIYSSGSVVAQKLFFGHTKHGDLRPFFQQHFDTSVGAKRESTSYRRIAEQLKTHAESILFLSDVAAELDAAREAGIQVTAVIRPGNAPLPDSYKGPRIQSFEELRPASVGVSFDDGNKR